MANNSLLHVTQTDDGRWQAKREGGTRASFVKDTQAEAIDAAKVLVKREGGSVVVHGRDGKIRKL
jgi:uncharacterized protein YdaT